MVSLEVVALVLTGLGLTASIVYYANVLSNANKTQQLQLETRQAQLYQQMTRDYATKEKLNDYIEMMNWQWDDYQDFEEKYGSDNNPEAFSIRNSIWGQYIFCSKMWKKGLIDINTSTMVMIQILFSNISVIASRFLLISTI